MAWRDNQRRYKRRRSELMGLGQLAATAAFALLALPSGEGRAAEALEQSIEHFSEYILAVWAADPVLSKTPPPQIITNIGAS